MTYKEIDWLRIITLAIGGFAVFLQIFPPENQEDQSTSLLIFFGIIFFVVVYLITDNIFRKVKEKIDQINANTKKIEEINKKINLESRFQDLDKRLALVEYDSKSERGKNERK